MSWRENAACLGMTQTIFFPPNRVWDEKHCATARRICASCPVKEPCLAEALKVTTNDDGIFAGTTPRQRNRMRGTTHKKKHKACEVCGVHFELGIHWKKCCSDRCWRVHEAEYNREWQRANRNNGRPNPIAKHGTVTMVKKGCKCAACTNHRRQLRRKARALAAARAASGQRPHGPNPVQATETMVA